MFRLHAIQARFGDCFLLEYGEERPEYILIDGGPAGNYHAHLKPVLGNLLKEQQTLEAVIISHVDNDHILGILDLLVDLKYHKDTGKEPFLNIKELWFNSFTKTIDTHDIESRMIKINAVAGANGIMMHEMNAAVNGMKEGYQVQTISRILDIPINPGAKNGFYLADKNVLSYKRSNLDITVVGPTNESLEKLRKEWEAWIVKNEQKIREGKYTKDFAAMADRSIPNLSSIILLIKDANGKSMLLTGDCRGDHLQQGLIETGLSTTGSYHADIFKVPHHGSKRNTDRKFFEEVTANFYIISADGTNGNPDDEVLSWIVESAFEAKRRIKFIFTNETPSTTSLLKKYKPEEWGYETKFINKGEDSLLVSL